MKRYLWVYGPDGGLLRHGLAFAYFASLPLCFMLLLSHWVKPLYTVGLWQDWFTPALFLLSGVVSGMCSRHTVDKGGPWMIGNAMLAYGYVGVACWQALHTTGLTQLPEPVAASLAWSLPMMCLLGLLIARPIEAK